MNSLKHAHTYREEILVALGMPRDDGEYRHNLRYRELDPLIRMTGVQPEQGMYGHEPNKEAKFEALRQWLHSEFDIAVESVNCGFSIHELDALHDYVRDND